MKVLHVWNTAGVASLICKEQRKNGIVSDVVMRKSHDPFGYTKLYKGTLLDIGGEAFNKYVIALCEDYDIIHIHAAYKLLTRIGKAYPGKKLIMHHHGTEVSRTPIQELILHYQYCHAIITSTPDISAILDKYHVKNHLIVNAVDTDLFKPNRRIKKNALYISTRYTNTEFAMTIANSRLIDMKIDTLDREKNFVSHRKFAQLLNRYACYIDIKCPEWLNGNPVQAISKTGLEALACGLTVVGWDGIKTGLPIQYTPDYQFNEIINLYK